ncbi:MAG TPA: FecR domain-containing protein [Rhizomicrobium sp.]|nr:FecR domain-containing protein [Rhizomicrobium sp.]
MTRAGTSLDEAIAWHIRINAPDADEAVWTEFTAWLEAGEANRMAFDRVEDFDSELTGFGAEIAAPIPLHEPRNARIWMAGAALLAASLILFIAVRPASTPAAIEYSTRTGETKLAMLSDGTRIDLNTATKILVSMNGDVRHVTLDRGEALFHVAKDSRRPFIVTVGDRDVRDIGTVFDILRNNGTITLFVAEGRVAVSPRGAHDGTIALAAGDQLVHAEAGGSTLSRADATEALAWRQGYLIYRDAPLSRVVSDLNRYFPVPITLDGAAASQRFTGVLRIDSETAVLNRISQFLPVKVEYGPGQKISLRAPATKL